MLVDFIKDDIKDKFTPEELSIALKVVKHFRNLESPEDYIRVNFSSWDIFHMFENGLEYLNGNKRLEDI